MWSDPLKILNRLRLFPVIFEMWSKHLQRMQPSVLQRFDRQQNTELKIVIQSRIRSLEPNCVMVLT